MGFSKTLLLILLALLVTACATTGPEDTPEQTAAAAEGDAGEQPPEEVFVPIPSPYQPQVSVPQQAKTEFATALELMREQKWEQAEAQLLLMTETYPELSGPYVNLGIIYRKQDKADDAEKALQFAIDTNPTNMDAYTQLGVVLREQGKFAQAEQVYLKALEVWPHHQASHRNLGILYDLYMGELLKARQHFEMLLKIQQDNPEREVRIWLADIERRLATREDGGGN